MLIGSLLPMPAAMAAARPDTGEAAPAILGRTPDGRQMTLDEHAGKVVGVLFWASWCGYCRQAMPKLEGLQKLVGPEQLRIVAVNTEGSAEFRKLARTLRHELTMQLTNDADGKVREAYGDKGTVPVLFIVGRDGRVKAVHAGYSDSALKGIVTDFQAALSEPAPALTSKSPDGA